MTIPIDPVLVSFGSLAIRWYGLLALTGLAVAVWLSLRELQQQHLGRRLALDGLAWALPAGLVGARVVHVLGYWDFYLTSPSELGRLDLSGLSLWGGLGVGGVIFAARIGRGRANRRRRILDAVVPFALLGVAIGRIGQFVDGRGQGLPSDLPWATRYANPLAATPDFGVPRHPAQLYDALVALLLVAALLVLERKLAAHRTALSSSSSSSGSGSLPPGSVAAIGIVAYSAARLALGAVRLDPAFAFGLQIEQLVALGGIVVGTSFGLRPLLQSLTVLNQSRADAASATHAAAPEDSLAA